jgi:hypothetical protein
MPGLSRGGSNITIHIMHVEGIPDRSVVADYAIEKDKINGQFQQLYDNDQRKARLCLWHTRQPDSQDSDGFYLNSLGGYFGRRSTPTFQRFLPSFAR